MLGAGGTLGEAFHRGVLRAMSDRGLDAREATVVVGTSAGSIVAATLRRRAAAVPDLVMRAPAARRLPDMRTVLGVLERPRQMLNAAMLAPELVRGRTPTTFLAEGLRRHHGEAWPQAPTWVVAVRRDTGRRVVFGRPGEPVADLGSAVAASCAIPGWFEPVVVDGVAYVDGGVHSPTNADLVADVDLDLVVVSSPMSAQPRALRQPRLDLPLRLAFHGYLRSEVWSLRRRGERVVAVEPDAAVLEVMGVDMMAGRHLDEVEERAHALALERLQGVG